MNIFEAAFKMASEKPTDFLLVCILLMLLWMNWKISSVQY